MSKNCLHRLVTLIISVNLFAVIIFHGATAAQADSSSPRLAAYYDRKMLLCGDTAYQWQGQEKPSPVADNITQVGVGRDASYALDREGRLFAWLDLPNEGRVVLDKVTWFASGRSGIFAIRTDSSLWFMARPEHWFREGDILKAVRIAGEVLTASVGDSANYYVTRSGVLYVKGLAHRGQYGDGKLQSSDYFIAVANGVTSVKAHTGHAILLTEDGVVMGTGGNIYGPLGSHGIGDKAIRWGKIFKNVEAIATGSSHSLSLRADGSLWRWGRNIGLFPEKVLDKVIAMAADSTSSIALLGDNTLWQWERGEQPRRYFSCP